MSTTVRRSLATSAGALTLSGALLFGLGGTALAAPAAPAPAPAAAPAAVAPTGTTVLADWDWHHRRCHREWHRASWSWDRWGHHGGRHYRPGWWSWSCR